MWTFFIVDASTYETTDWKPEPWLDVAPILITQGDFEGGYAVNVEIFNAATEYEQYRTLLESMPTEVCDDLSDWWDDPEE